MERNQLEFREGKSKLTYYMLSLPFALASVAIASYPYPGSHLLIFVEGVAWILLLGAGAAGLLAKHAELEVYRVSAIKSSVALARAQSKDPETPEAAELAASRERRILKEEGVEEKARRSQWWLLACGGVVWVASRLGIAIVGAAR